MSLIEHIFRPEGYRSESDIEDEEPFDVDSDGSEGSSSRIPISTSVTCNPPTKMTTLPNGSKVGMIFFLIFTKTL